MLSLKPKHFRYTLGALALSLVTGVCLFLYHATHTFAWGSNTDPLDPDFWNNQWNGTDAMIISSLFGDGNIGNDKTFYTQYWQTNSCDTSAMTVQYITSGSSVPLVFEQNTVYVFDASDFVVTGAMILSGDCVGITSKLPAYNSYARIYYYSGITNPGVLYGSGNKNIITEVATFVNHLTLGGSITDRPNAGTYCENCQSSTFASAAAGVQQTAIQIESGQYVFMPAIGGGLNYGLYVDNSDHIFLGTPRPTAYFGYNQTGAYIADSTNIVVNADPRWNYKVGVHVYNSTGVYIQSRYFTDNFGLGLLLENVYSGTVNGYFDGNGGGGLRILNSTHIRSQGWLDATTNYGSGSFGMQIENSQDVIVTGATINANPSHGLLISGSSDITFANTSMSSNASGGVIVKNSNNITLKNDVISGNHTDGIYIQSVTGLTIDIATITHNYANGIFFEATPTDILGYNTISSSTIASNGDAGIRMQGNGSQLTNNTFTDNDIHDNVTDGIYMHRGYVSNFDTNQVYANGENGIYLYQTVNNIITGQLVYQNGAAGIAVDGFANNSIYNSTLYQNTTDGLKIHDMDNAIFTKIVSYNNSGNGISIESGSDTSTGSKVVVFANGQDGIYVDADAQTDITNLQSYNNLRNGITYASTQGSVVHNALVYNNAEAGLELIEGARYGAFNNINLYANAYATKMIGGSLGIENNAFNNVGMFGNTTGWYIGPTNSNNNSNVRNNIYIYNNDAGIVIDGPIASSNNLMYGNFHTYNNGHDVVSNIPNQIVSTLSPNPEPNAGRLAGSLKSGFGLPVSTTDGIQTFLQFSYSPSITITCNDAIQTSWGEQNMFGYPLCGERGYNGAWIAGLGVQYTFFPNIKHQEQPVGYDNSILSPIALDYYTDMFVGDYAYIGDTPIGGYVLLDTDQGVQYLSGGFIYKNYPEVLLHMLARQGSPDYINTGVGDPTYDGLTTTYGGTFQTPLTDTIGLPLYNQEGIRIVRTYYTDGQNISNYYGFIRGLAYDDIGIVKTASTGAVKEGGQISFTIKVHNTGALAGTSQVFDFLPRAIDASGLQTDPVATYSGDLHALIWDLPEVAEDTTYTFTITGTIIQGALGNTFINTGYFISDLTHSGNDLILYSEAPFDVVSSCGDMIIDSGEQCDDGIGNGQIPPVSYGSQQYCSNTCTLETVNGGYCGDGVTNGPEACDDGNTNNGDGCNSTCELETPTCTLTVVSQTGGTVPLAITRDLSMSNRSTLLYIDYGDASTGTNTGHTYTSSGLYFPLAVVANPINTTIASTCTSSYILSSDTYCGDGIPNGQEACDDGANNGQVCNPNYGQTCEYCTNSCTIDTVQGATCSDGIVQTGAGEQCDEGANNGLYGCSGDCQFKQPHCNMTASPMTGFVPLFVTLSGARDNYASLDYIDYKDGSTGTQLSHTYTTHTLNGYRPMMYIYNTTYPSKTGFCSLTNKFASINPTIPYCGDSVVTTGETCDGGGTNGIVCNPSYGGSCNYCTDTCQTNSVQGGYCGDGITENTEQCDDGNSNNTDLCSNTCVATCGDGDLDNNEECDLGDNNGLGACTTSCTFAPPQCTIIVPDHINGPVPVYVPFQVQCSDISKLTYINYGDGTTGKNFSGHTYASTGGYTPTIYFQNVLGGPVDDNNDQTQIQTQSTPTPYCGDGIKNNNEQCDGTSDCTTSCTIKTSNKIVDPKDNCPDGDFSASYYDKTCGEPTQHAAAEILDKYSIIHGDYNKGPEDPARYSLDRILKWSELRKIMVRTMTDQKYQAPFAGETWADKYKMILENTLHIVYGKSRAHEDQVTYLEAVNSILEASYYLGITKSPITLRSMNGGSKPITRGKMMALVVRFVLPQALESVQEAMTKVKR